MATNKRTYINADEELIIQGKLTIEGNVEQKQYTVENNYIQSNFEGEQLIVNSDGFDANSNPVAGTLTLRYGAVEGNLSVDNNGNLVIDGDLDVTGSITGTIVTTVANAQYADTAGNLLTTRNFSISGDVSSPNVGFNGDQNVVLNTTLANVFSSPDTYGSAAIVPVITVDSKGRLTNAVDTPISITSSNVTDFDTSIDAHLTGGTGIDYSAGEISITDIAGVSGSYGSASDTQTVTVNGQGQITSIGDVAISVTASQVSDFVSSANTAIENYISADSNLTFASGLISHNLTTTDITEGVNLYYTDQRVQDYIDDNLPGANDANVVSVNGETGVVVLDTAHLQENGNIFFTTDRANAAFDVSIATKDTTDLAEDPSATTTSGTMYFTETRSRESISVTDAGGDGSLSYNDATGVITYTGPSASEVRAHFTGGDGINLSSGDIAVDTTVIRTTGIQTIAGDLTVTGNADFTGAVITATTQAQGDGSTKVATTAYVDTAVSELVDGAVPALDTLNELATALNNNESIGAQITNNTARIGTLEGRNINAGDGLSGTGNLSADITLTVDSSVARSSTTFTAANGLTGGGTLASSRSFNVGAGTGIIVNADDVQTDDAHIRGLISASGNINYNSTTGVISESLTTDDIAEGTNLYYTTARANSDFDTRLATKDTADLTEGSNLYYTTDRANAATEAYLSGGTGIDYSTGVIDLADTSVTAGTYGDADTTVTITLDAQGRSTAISENTIDITSSQVSDFQAQSRTEMNAYLTGGDGINYSVGTIDVDTTVIRTTGNQSLSGTKNFTESLIVPHTSNTADGSIYYNGTDFWGVVNGQPAKLTPSSDVGDVEDVGTGEVDIYAGFRTIALGNANVNVHGIKSLSSDSIIDLSESANVITVGSNSTALTSAIRSAISANDAGGDGSFGYNSGTGVFTYTGPSASEVRQHLSGGAGINYNSTTGVISSTNDNFNSWIVETDSGAGSAETITSNERVTFAGGTNITVTNTGNVITIRNDNVADITAVTAGSGLTGGGNNGAVTLNVGAGTGVTVAADAVSIGQDVATTADVEFNSIKLSTIGTPTHEEGLVFYDTDNKALAVYNDEADITLQVGQEEWLRVFNNSGDTILNGKPVYVVGAINGIPSIELASANTEVEAYAVGLATHDISSNSEGYVTTRGLVRGLNTLGLTEGERAHVGVTAGTLQTASPTYPYFSTDVGIVVDSDATDGSIYVDITHHVTETFRVTDDARVDGDMTVAGNLTVMGTQSVLSISSLAVSDSFIYTNSGDTIGVAGTDFTGTGLDDGVFTGHYEGTTTNKTYYVRIDGVGVGAGGVDTFEWSLDNFSTTEATDIDITGSDQSLEDGISIKFNATTGHTSGDVWDGSASPVNVDTGIVSNRNTGTSGIGYTHMGMFFDVTDEKFKFFEAYAPEPDGDIDTGNASFALGTVVAEEFEATTFTGDLTGDVTGTVSSISNHDTGDLSEGTNLYYTDARARAALSATGDATYNSTTGQFSVTTYKTADFTTDFNNKSTSDLSEGTNLYYTDARARSALSGGTGITYNSSTGEISLTDTGYVTGVTAGSGLTGGGASGTVTLNVGAGTGITVGADSISVTSSHINSLIDTRVTQSFVNGLSVTAAFSDQVYVTEENTNASTQRIVFHGGDGSGNKALRHDDSLTYVPDTNTLTVGVLSASTSVNTDLVNVGTTLDISSNGTDSEITESGSGALWIKGTNLLLADSTGTTKYLTGIASSGETSLFYGGSQKLKTTNVGVTVTGDVTATNFNGVASSAKYADLAEKYTADADYEPGTVVVHGGEAEVTTTTKIEDTRVAGVISTDPAYMMNSEADGIYVALRGRVPCKVMGMVKKGDVLVTCEVAGYAVASPNPHMVPAASIIGKAVSNHNDNGPGIVEVLV